VPTTRTGRRIEDVSGPPRALIVPSGVLAMLIFVGAEIMLFAGFVSAFTIMRASAVLWPPPNQPRLPVEETAFNTLLLLLSGVSLFFAARRHRRGSPSGARVPLALSIALGVAFVLLQGREWVSLLGAGLTLTSSALGSFFYLIVGMHALHAVVALGVLVYAWRRLQRGFLPATTLAAAEVFWYFVVAVWPVLYWRVYLS
jgi:heme/copper-type cytochrome/quinol oxidase subunit 3